MTVIAREPPTRPLNPLDRAILALLDSPRRPVELAGELGVRTHAVAVRLRSLTERGLVRRIRPVGAARNGPGAALYVRQSG